MTDYEIPRPTEGDVVELILDDHRLFEELLRHLRDVEADRAAARSALADAVIAHGEAEESEVYPQLRHQDAISAHDEHHGEEEHAEGNVALLELLRCEATDSPEFDDAVEKLATALNHHIGEEEQTILNPARTEVSEDVRRDLGTRWTALRNHLLDDRCGSPGNVERIVERDQQQGLLEEGG